MKESTLNLQRRAQKIRLSNLDKELWQLQNRRYVSMLENNTRENRNRWHRAMDLYDNFSDLCLQSYDIPKLP